MPRDAATEQLRVSQGLYMISGATAGICADCFMHPVDTVRTRLQAQSGNSMYTSLPNAFGTIYKTEGFSALYKGFPIVAAATVPAHALYFGGYELSKQLLGDSNKGFTHYFLSGMIADICGNIIWTPMDTVKQRLQVQLSPSEEHKLQLKYKGSLHGLTTIFKEEGPRGLYKGFIPTIATYGPYSGIYFALYEKFKKSFATMIGCSSPNNLPFYYHMVCGSSAAAIAAAVTCPLDVVKTRIQVHNSNITKEYDNIFKAIRTLYLKEGIMGFSKGLSARILWLAPGSAITISVYEQCQNLYQSFWNKLI